MYLPERLGMPPFSGQKVSICDSGRVSVVIEMEQVHQRVLIEMAEEYGYGLQVTRGLSRYRVKRPNWIFQRCPTAMIRHVRKGSYIGAIGHYHEAAQLKALKNCEVPFYVSVSSRGEPDWWPRVIPDDRHVGRVAAEYFLRKGYRNYAVSYLGDMRFAQERTKGFCDRLRKEGITQVQILGKEAWLPSPEQMPMALFALNDVRALSHINRFVDAGIKVPEDVAVLGADDDELVAFYSPVAISSVQLPLEQIGFAACDVLEAMVLSGKQEYGTHMYQALGVIERRSTEGTVVTDARVRKAQAYMEAHLTELEGIDALAAALHLNRRTLERLFERSIGLSPASWLMRRRTEYAEKLIAETDYTVEYVAELAGFEDRRRLYRAFKKLGRPLPSVIRGSL
jgi:LacI family transcriptional regulator